VSPAARSAVSAARSARHPARSATLPRRVITTGRQAGRPNRPPGGQPSPARCSGRAVSSPSRRAWTTLVDGSWISARRDPKLVDRAPCADGSRRAIIWSARRGRGIRIAGPPQGGRALRKVSRVLRKGNRPLAREARDLPADSSSATMTGTPSARTDGEPQGAPVLPQGGRAPQGVAMDGRNRRSLRVTSCPPDGAVDSGTCTRDRFRPRPFPRR
jgi:hypothetical protein